MGYIVYFYEPPTDPAFGTHEPAKCRAYGVVDMQGPHPGSQADCEALAAEIREQHPLATVMVVPFGEYLKLPKPFTRPSSTALREPIPDPPLHPDFAVVQPFPVVETNLHELVVPPREYGTLVEHPAIPIAA